MILVIFLLIKSVCLLQTLHFADRDTIIFKDSGITSLDMTVCWVASLTSVTRLQEHFLGQTRLLHEGQGDAGGNSNTVRKLSKILAYRLDHYYTGGVE